VIFDSQEQKQKVIDLIGEAPIHTNIAGLLSGPSQDLMALMGALNNAPVIDPEGQTAMMLHYEVRKREGEK